VSRVNVADVRSMRVIDVGAVREATNRHNPKSHRTRGERDRVEIHAIRDTSKRDGLTVHHSRGRSLRGIAHALRTGTRSCPDSRAALQESREPTAMSVPAREKSERYWTEGRRSREECACAGVI
jgi:hypothetical protein